MASRLTLGALLLQEYLVKPSATLWKLIALLVLVTAGCTTSSPGSGSAQVIAELSSADVSAVRLTVTGSGIASPITSALVKSGATWTATVGEIPAGPARVFHADALDAGEHVLYTGQATTAIAADQQTAVMIVLQQVDPPPPYGNSAPAIDAIVLSGNTVAPGGTVTATVTAHDPDGDAMTYAWSASGGSFGAGNAAGVTWTAPATEGAQSLTIQVSDPSGAKAVQTVTIQVAVPVEEGSAEVTIGVNNWPITARVDAVPTRIDAGESTALAVSASDADGDALRYAWSASCAGAFSDTTAARPTFTLATAPSGHACTLTVIVSDGRGGQDAGALTIQAGPSAPVIIAPQVDAASQSQATAGGSEALAFRITAHDPQGQALTFTWAANTGTFSGQSDTAGASSVTWTSAACGALVSPVITATVTNALGASTKRTFTVSSTCSSWTQVAGIANPVAIAIAPNTFATPYSIYVGTAGNGVYHSSDGVTWASTGPASVVSLAAMPQVQNCNAGMADGTVQATANTGASWAATSASPGHVINAWYSIAGAGPFGASSNGAGAAQVFQGKSSGSQWIASAAFGTGVGTGIAFGGGASPSAILYVSVNGTGGGVFKSTTAGAASYSFSSTNFPQTQVLSIASAATSPTTVFAGTSGQGAGIYVSTDGGATWNPSGTGLGNTVVKALAVDPSNAQNVYAGTAAGIYVSKNGGATWTLSGVPSSAVTALAILNGTPSTVYAATASGLYVTTTGGQ